MSDMGYEFREDEGHDPLDSPAFKYLSVHELEEMSGVEVDEYVTKLTDGGRDDGPEWDRIYRWLEKKEFI